MCDCMYRLRNTTLLTLTRFLLRREIRIRSDKSIVSQIVNECIYLLHSKRGFAKSRDCSAQTLDPCMVCGTIHGLAAQS